MLGGADNPNGELPSYITGANIIPVSGLIIVNVLMPYGRLHCSRSIFGEDPYLKLSISGLECLKGLRSG